MFYHQLIQYIKDNYFKYQLMILSTGVRIDLKCFFGNALGFGEQIPIMHVQNVGKSQGAKQLLPKGLGIRRNATYFTGQEMKQGRAVNQKDVEL